MRSENRLADEERGGAGSPITAGPWALVSLRLAAGYSLEEGEFNSAGYSVIL